MIHKEGLRPKVLRSECLSLDGRLCEGAFLSLHHLPKYKTGSDIKLSQFIISSKDALTLLHRLAWYQCSFFVVEDAPIYG